MDKKNILTYQGLQKLEDELQNLKVVRRKEVAQKIKEARDREIDRQNLRTLLVRQSQQGLYLVELVAVLALVE